MISAGRGRGKLACRSKGCWQPAVPYIFPGTTLLLPLLLLLMPVLDLGPRGAHACLNEGSMPA